MNKEELFISECRFFSRLDVRLIALSNLLNEHESVLLATAGSKKEEIDKVRKFHKDLFSSLIKEDKKTVDYYTNYFDKLEKEQKMSNKDLTVKTLHKVVDYLINDSAEDICQMCIYINREYQDLPDDVEPCFYKRTNGKVACRNGIIEYFQREVNNVKD